MSDLPEPRIADVDRERVSQHLRVAYSEGRITEVELEDRLTAVFEARTASELNVVVVDLPVPPISISRPPAAPPSPMAEEGLSFHPQAAVPLLMPAMICTVIYLMTTAGGYFWPMWVWFGCGIPAIYAVLGSRESGEPDPPEAPPEVAP